MTYSFIFKDSFMDLTKTRIREIQTDEEVLLHPKWSFPIGKYSFFSGKEEYKAISTKEHFIHNAFVVLQPDGKEIVRMKNLSLHKKKSIFKELRMVYSQNSFHINSTLAFKTITISNGKEVILTANKISSIFKNLLEMYDYEVQVHQTMNLPFIVWVAIFKGIHLLIRR
ncbi:hypothetical protein Q8A72_09350 [Aeribacillus pallidus]|uniref:hypothetical protein n=1 Tax=unclassified Aeribacillus TaxID=2640495 RepID=UPI00287227F7|nr:hypothetical protein [Aeribacillus pallidus]